MKKILAILITTVLFTISSQAQISVGIYSGFGQSSFDEDILGEGGKVEQAGYIPAGLQLLYKLPNMSFGAIYLGAEVDYAVVPFTFEMSDDIGNGPEKLADFKINQMVIGALVKVKFGQNNLRPFLRLGGGAYTGGADIEYTEKIKELFQQQYNSTLEDEEIDIKTAFGFNIGAGADLKIGSSNALFAEFVYHMVSREADGDDSESFSANNWAAHIGFQFGLN
ncbi:MAG: porin family protein [Melioribacteraceae bacterium]|nr:porin family protein [Melioribacteraceae bacterium]